MPGERGEIIYNLVLSDQRALATRDALISLGVPTERMVFAIGWGKLYPVCQQLDESCWSDCPGQALADTMHE